jgi:hypothetical protein
MNSVTSNVLIGTGMAIGGLVSWFGLLFMVRAVYRKLTKATTTSSGPFGVPIGVWLGASGMNFLSNSHRSEVGLAGSDVVAQDLSIFALVGLGIGLLVRAAVRHKEPAGLPSARQAPGHPEPGRPARRRPAWMWVSAGIGVALVLGLVTLGQVRAASVPAASTAAPYRDDQQHFSLTPPAGWAVRQSGQPNVSVLFVGPVEGQVAGRAVEPFLNVVVAPAPGTLDSQVAGHRQYYAAKVQLNEDTPASLPDGRPAHFLGGTLDSPAGALRMLQLVAVDDGREYLLTSVAPAATFSRHEPEVRAALLTLKLG